MSKQFFIVLFQECLRGKSLVRTLHNIYLKDINLEGNGVDYGSKNTSPSYYRFINLNKKKMKFVDINSNVSKEIIKIDFEKPFDLSKSQFDFALMFNILEHIFNYEIFLKNVYNSIKNNGRIEGIVPFLLHYHADPDDFQRFTHTGLRRLLENQGFREIVIIPLGVGIFTSFFEIFSKILKIKIFIYISWILALYLDKFLSLFWKRNRDIYSSLIFRARK